MKAAVLHASKDIRYEEIATPAVGRGEVRVKSVATGICGSDIPRYHADAAHSFPLILGHEFSGYVDEVGEGVTSVQKGDHVVGIPLVPCFECEDCRAGNFSLCKHYSFVGSRRNGSMAEYVTLPEGNVMKIDPSIPFESAAMFEPSTVAIHGVNQCGYTYEPGKTVAILGGGTIGLFTLQWVKILGCDKAVVTDIDAHHLENAKKLGADATVVSLDEDFSDQVAALTGGRGFDYVFVSTGSVAAMKTAFEIAGNKAHLCFIGTPTRELSFSIREWENMNRKEFYLTGSWMSYSAPWPGSEWSMTDEHFAKGDLKVIPEMIHKVYDLKDAETAFNEYLTPQNVMGKILLVDKK
jgi:L-iditol 2-dehydrogenase